MLIEKKTAITIPVAVFLFLIDRILKFYALKLEPYYNILGDFIKINFIKNQYISFSIPFNANLLKFLIPLLLIALVYYIAKNYKKSSFTEFFSLSIVFVGGFSNLLDRLKYGFVIDYIDFKFFSIFNIADVMVSFGIILFLFSLHKKPLKKI